MTIFGVLGAAMLALSTTSQESIFSANATNRARFLAESGLRIAQAHYCAEGELITPLTITLLSGEQVLIETLPADAGFSALATAHAGSPLEARAKVFGVLPECGSVDPGPGDGSSPDDYVIYAGGSDFVLPPGGFVDGSVFGEKVEIKPNSTITGNVISSEDVKIESGVKIGGYICAADGKVELKSSGTVVTGDIYANDDVILGSGTIVLGSIFTKGKVELKPGAFVGGDIHAREDVVLESGAEVRGSIYSRGEVELKSDAIVGGDIHAKEDVILKSNTSVGGSVYAGGSIEKSSSATIGGQRYTNQSSPPRIEPLPPTGCPPTPRKPKLQTFSHNSDHRSIPSSGVPVKLDPATYGDLTFPGSGKVILTSGNGVQPGSNPGRYTFRSIEGGWNSEIHLNLSVPGDIVVFVSKKLHFRGTIKVSLDGINYVPFNTIPKEQAKRVYWETHETFKARKWFGTVLSKEEMDLESFVGIGALATRDGEIKFNGTTPHITYVIADFAKNHWLP